MAVSIHHIFIFVVQVKDRNPPHVKIDKVFPEQQKVRWDDDQRNFQMDKDGQDIERNWLIDRLMPWKIRMMIRQVK